MKTIKIALAGNPNCGKTSIFNMLTGTRQHVGNYPGVTVESKGGYFTLGNHRIELVDLPGVYSMSSNSPEEAVAFHELTRPGIDLIINVVDSTILQRSLYLTNQLLELGIPMILVFNMSDEAKRKGFEFNIDAIEKQFAVPIVKTVGTNAEGIVHLEEHLLLIMDEIEAGHITPPITFRYNPAIEAAIEALIPYIDTAKQINFHKVPSRFLAIKMLERDRNLMAHPEFEELLPQLNHQTELLSHRTCHSNSTFMADYRYAAIVELCRWNVRQTKKRTFTKTRRIDDILTNRWAGLPIFLGFMYLMFWFTFTAAEPFMTWIESGFSHLANLIGSHWNVTTLPVIRDLIIEGVIGGVGGVIVFLPNIVFLFLCIAIMEDLGYMSRAAFVMDGVMRKFGLQGRSFVPLILGFGCNVPAIMATRSIESVKDRTVTILALPLMSCGARLPIYALFIPVFFSEKYRPLVMWGMYLIGITIAMLAARLMKSTLFRGERDVFMMELPPYRVPTLKNVFLQVWDQGKSYLHKAGTIILLTSVLLFICNNYPKKQNFSQNYEEQKITLLAQIEASANQAEISAMTNKLQNLENEKRAELLEYTISGRVGHALEPIFKPLGFDWKVSTALVGALAAKEVFVSQLGIIYAAGANSENTTTLRHQLRCNYNKLQAFCIMLFCLLSIPCAATLAVIKRELNSTKLAVCEAIGLFLLAYIITFIVFHCFQ